MLSGDILSLPLFRKIIDEATEIVKQFKRKSVLNALFREKSSKQLKLPVKTRWNSCLACLTSVCKAKHTLQEISIRADVEGIVDSRIKKSLLKNVFWENAEMLITILQPISKWTSFLEQDCPQLSAVVASFSDINASFTATFEKENCSLTAGMRTSIEEMLQNRRSFSLKRVHLAANLLDPKYRGV